MPTRTSKRGGAELAEDFDAFDGVDVGVEVAHLEAGALEVFAEVLGGFFGEGGDQHALVAFDALAAELDGFVDLALERAQGDHRVEQAGGADDLLDDERRAALGGIEGSATGSALPLGDDADFLRLACGEAGRPRPCGFHRDVGSCFPGGS
jgi:hypothetical protein